MTLLDKLRGSSTREGAIQVNEGHFIRTLKTYIELAERNEEDDFPKFRNKEINEIINRLSALIHRRENYYKLRLNMLTEAVNIGLWEMEVINGDPVNPNNQFWWSAQFKRTLGFKDEHHYPNVLSSWSKQLHPDDLEPLLAALTNHLNDQSGQTPYNIKFRLRSKNGEYRWYQAGGETIRDENGVPLRVAGTIRDITHEVMKEEVMRQVNMQMEGLLVSINEIVRGIVSVMERAQHISEVQEQSHQAVMEVKEKTEASKEIPN